MPANFEQHEGARFDGVGIYRKRIPALPLPAGNHAVLHFQAAATLTEVTCDGHQVGTHLGGWTPFRLDVTDQLRQGSPATVHELSVRVDEQVGHNTQGFLPVVAPHFGGIWQDAQLLIVPDCWIDDLRLLSVGDPDTGCLHLKIPLHGVTETATQKLAVRYRLLGHSGWSEMATATVANDTGTSDPPATGAAPSIDKGTTLNIPVPDWQYWSPAEPNLYEVEIRLIRGEQTVDRVISRAAFRSLKTDGARFLLNGQPLLLHGLLNWGYAPPNVAPSIDPQHIRSELEFARSHGFNLMKFCLWIPPQRYLDMADEMGMLTWMEYPTWHSRWTPDQLTTLEPEFTEFFYYDRNHPCVTLRSLTCETGTGADLGVIRALYERCHAMIPGAIVEDDSSWIGWNRIHDFYDDHPYGNNQTWVATLDKLKQYISERDEKPLVLGEAIAADTWVDRQHLLDAVGDNRPFWLPRFFDGDKQWVDRMRSIAGPGGIEQLESESKRYALLMRKYQIEAYRREVPFGGYVVSVIRDIPSCSMGLIDHFGQPKWSADQWNWHGNTMLLCQTENDRRSFTSGETFHAELALSHFGRHPIRSGHLEVTLRVESPTDFIKTAQKELSLDAGQFSKLEPLDIVLPEVTRPTRLLLQARLSTDLDKFENQWPMWLVPKPTMPLQQVVRVHESCAPEVSSLFTGALQGGEPNTGDLVVTARLDGALIDFLTAGGRVLMLPDGQQGSLPLSDQWFLRGAPYLTDHPVVSGMPRRLLIELQHFDLAGPVIPDIKYLEQIDPVLMLWNNHDLDEVKTEGLVFETRLGQGRLLVSALRHTSPTNSVGRFLAGVFLQHLATGPPPQHALLPQTVESMRAKIQQRTIDLTRRQWQFRPDPDNQGLQDRWQMPDVAADDHWKPIQVGRAWEGLGYPDLDGWAWYRITVDIPRSWQGSRAYVSFQGVDDYYELYVDGVKIGSGGNIATKTTAFDQPKSFDVSKHAEPGKRVVIAVRVYDWYGAGGLFRPVTLSTAPLASDELDVLAGKN